MKKIILALVLISPFTYHLSPCQAQHIDQYHRPQQFNAAGYRFYDPEVNWVDSVFQSLSLEQRIAQLMVVRVPLDMDDSRADEFSKTINGYGVGGVCFFAGTAERQARMTRRFQADARVPLLVCLDAEWGLGMRLTDMYSFPRNSRFGELPPSDDSIVYRMGEEIGRQCRMMGVHVNFAPVVDINSNPKNPVIGTRSYGTDRERVAQLGIMFALGQQSQGVMAVAKHFPGHGDTDVDSHLDLPVINHKARHLDSVELYPFKRMIDAGVGGVMTAHLQVNAFDHQHPASLSHSIVTGLLRNKFNFSGLVFTDGLDMKGITNTYQHGDGELLALQAGNDILLLPPNVQEAIQVIAEEAAEDDSLRFYINKHCRRVLQEKYNRVLPNLKNEISVPGADCLAACQDIVADLNLALDKTIDSIVDVAISAHATPGCQIVVLHKGRKIIDRAYGHFTYDTQAAEVTPQTVYDLASLTKVTATTLAIMKLVDDGKIKIDDKLSKHLPYLKKTDKADITIKQVMSHCARFKAFDAYWKEVSGFDSILSRVVASPLNDKEGMVYSDLGFMLLSDLVRYVSGKTLDQYVDEHFYNPMGLTSTKFNPTRNGVDLALIAPTEQDSLRGLIQGDVHDPNAFAMGGVSGHAGLFSTAGEVAELMQMLLDGGQYRGRRYLKQSTIELFTKRHFASSGNRRALGFDKQLFNPSSKGQTCPEASQNSFGHTGFTGTMLWVDPDNGLVYVFLSNRVHPSAETNLLAQMNIRTDIQSILYQYLNH
ncbi:MAG: serine hydrolase [Bacteroidales bacterium]|nr:serine hydrolase [Bacteroidales bacterium]